MRLSQPTISSHIKDLEDYYDCRLIDRLSKEAVPTKAGELLYGYAKRMLTLRDETETALAEFKGKIRGRLVIGGSTQAICQGIKTGAGVSILSTLAVSEDLQAQKLIALEVDGLNLKRNFYLTWHRYRSPSPLNQAFVQFLEKELSSK